MLCVLYSKHFHHCFQNLASGGGPTAAEAGNSARGSVVSNIRRNPSMRVGSGMRYFKLNLEATNEPTTFNYIDEYILYN